MWTKSEILAMLDDRRNPDRWANACDWLEEVSGEEVPNTSYSEESILEAVESEDPSLLHRI